MSAKRKQSATLRLLRGEDLELVRPSWALGEAPSWSLATHR